MLHDWPLRADACLLPDRHARAVGDHGRDRQLHDCTGVQCLGNAGINTPTLGYGQATGVGPFVCESATTGITCTANGRGFLISSAGITQV